MSNIDYSKTVHLPKTDFPRRAGLAQKEPELQARWDKMDLYRRQREAGHGRKKFILHMGPPFANGNIHLGHVLSTVLKDVVCKSHQMLGYDSPLVPGFDCHGLPIEWKIEEEYRAKGKTGGKGADRVEFLKACRDFAAKWVEVQSGEFQRLGILADWKNPYRTMDRKSEAVIAGEVHKFLLNGSLYRGSKPVMWSIPEQTALAEAEVEYKDITSDTVWVKFPVKRGLGASEGAAVVIWTTTPWTLPGNRAIGYGADLNYVGIETNLHGRVFVCADLKDAFLKDAACVELGIFWSGKGAELAGTVCHHPLQVQGYGFDVPLLAGDFVTTDTGTGFVHIAPGHGEDDYRLGVKNGIEVPHTVAGDGKYFPEVPVFAGAAIYYPDGKKGPANKLVIAAIETAGHLVARGQITHSYPHSWRSKAPVIFRNTPQWFISMDKNGLRDKALTEIRKTKWYPERGQNRIGSMVELRGDWCVSRQRVWGVPLAIFVDKKTGEPLKDEKVLKRIVDIFERDGSEEWFKRPPGDFLGAGYDPDDYEQVRDIVDVWMESGITQEFVLAARAELAWPADLYLEGSDQHRGWFQSSLLVACGTKGVAPYKAVLTHGFILDEKGYKMSKSQGNVTSPAKLMEMYGADILRLWVTGSDYTEDTKFGENILKGHADLYRRIRGTLCYLLGSLGDPFNKVEYKDLSDLDRYILHRVFEIDGQVRRAVAGFDFLEMTTAVHGFCARELSAFYLDICKDALYCEATDSPRRRAVLTVLDAVFNFLCRWLAPVLSFTAEEAWLVYQRVGMDDLSHSVHLTTFPEPESQWHRPDLGESWDKIMAARSVVTGALEVKRAEKTIGSALEAAPVVYVADAALKSLLEKSAFDDVCITSAVALSSAPVPAAAFTLEGVPGIAVVVDKAPGVKCERCWKYTTDVGHDAAHATVCARCADAVRKQQRSEAA